jgi:hypothetical protein
VHPDGSEAFNPALDQFAPPAPPSGAFDARISVGGEDYFTKFLDNSLEAKSFTFSYANATGADPISFSWDPAGLEELGSFTIQDTFGGGIFSAPLTDYDGSVTPSVLSPVLANGFVLVIVPSAQENDPVAAAPVIEPAPGTYIDEVSVVMSTPTPGATIHYTTDGSTPTESDQAYTGAFPLTEDTILSARAFAPGTTPSTVTTAEYIIVDYLTQVTGEKGWRLMGLPVDGIPVSNLALQNQVQGVSGLDNLYGDVGYDAAAPNFLFFEDVAGPANDALIPPASVNTPIASGQGFVWYFFDRNTLRSEVLPFTLGLVGTAPASDITQAQNSNQTVTLLANPFSTELSRSDITGNIQADVQVWNPSIGESGGYEVVTNLPPFTGFFAENAGGGGDVTMAFNPATEPLSVEDEVARIQLRLVGTDDATGAQVSDYSTHVRFLGEAAGHGWDVFDLSKLYGFNTQFASVSLVGSKQEEVALKVIDSRPLDLQDTIEIPISFNAAYISGHFELATAFEHIPETWDVHLKDMETGAVTDARLGALEFNYADEARPAGSDTWLPEQAGMPLSAAYAGQKAANPEARFMLIVEPQPTSAPVESDLPQNFTLNQNYPNPFNPTTSIEYALPEATDVTLEVYNLQGQRVAVLVNGQQSAGSYNVSFDARNLASGMYLYRIKAGNFVQVQKMMLLK